MDVVNAIAKVRFASARPQRVRLGKVDPGAVDMLCMEAGQETRIRTGPWAYYVVMGRARLTAGGDSSELPAGQMAFTDDGETHTLANAGEGRLVCLAFAPA